MFKTLLPYVISKLLACLAAPAVFRCTDFHLSVETETHHCQSLDSWNPLKKQSVYLLVRMNELFSKTRCISFTGPLLH